MNQLEFSEEVVRDWAAIRSGLDTRDLAIAQRLIWIGRTLEDLLEKVAVECGLRRRGDYEVLALIRRAAGGKVTPLLVSQLLRSSASGMTKRIDRLESAGLLIRSSDPADRRAVNLALTPEGGRVVDKAFDLGLALYRRMLEGVVESSGPLDESLRQLLGNLDLLASQRHPWRSDPPKVL